MTSPAASERGIKDAQSCHSALDAESRREGEATNCFLLRPDPRPLDSRFHGNDARGCRMPPLTPPQAGGVLKIS